MDDNETSSSHAQDPQQVPSPTGTQIMPALLTPLEAESSLQRWEQIAAIFCLQSFLPNERHAAALQFLSRFC